MNNCFLELLGNLLPQGASPRKAAKVIASLKTPSAHKNIMEMVVEKLHTSGHRLSGVAAIQLYGDPVAEFP